MRRALRARRMKASCSWWLVHREQLLQLDRDVLWCAVGLTLCELQALPDVPLRELFRRVDTAFKNRREIFLLELVVFARPS